MATKNNPGKFDCYANAEPDEPMFVLLARDPCAPEIVQLWCSLRAAKGKNQINDPQIVEARKCASEMARWHDRNRGKHAVELTDEEMAVIRKHREAKG